MTPKAKDRKSITARDWLGVHEGGDSQCEIKEGKGRTRGEWGGKERHLRELRNTKQC